ncbi:uncharacterized protein LOC127874079, partial [Dreissena polymorpha]|uniref:uncharacterized protein LOC127874079 n=1 Tax=Dreissena polymorpha TaxID=45954 RepID=UPI0022641345
MVEGRHMRSPDFVSDWLYLSVDKGRDLLKVPHGLGVVPVLVQVATKPPSGPNKDFVFNGIGEIPRDDDFDEPYGAVSYLYDKEFVLVTTMSRGNDLHGKAILTMNNRYFVGPNSQTSDDCYVQILAWKPTSLPEPDFHVDNISVKSGCSKGSGFICYYDKSFEHGILMYGFNKTTFRIWTEIQLLNSHYLYYAGDGSGFGIQVQHGTLEILAWKEMTLAPTETINLFLGTHAKERFDQEKLMSTETRGHNYFVQLWATARSGPNVHYRFLASGSMASTSDPKISPCTFGGIEFAYSDTALRLWKPNNSFNRASIICVPNIFAGGKYSQSSNDAFAVAHVWITVDHNLHAECNTTQDCLDGNSACSNNFTCQCQAGFKEIHREENITVKNK